MNFVCPTCQRQIYDRRHATCGFCGSSLPSDFLFTKAELEAMDAKDAEEQDLHRRILHESGKEAKVSKDPIPTKEHLPLAQTSQVVLPKVQSQQPSHVASPTINPLLALYCLGWSSCVIVCSVGLVLGIMFDPTIYDKIFSPSGICISMMFAAYMAIPIRVYIAREEQTKVTVLDVLLCALMVAGSLFAIGSGVALICAALTVKGVHFSIRHVYAFVISASVLSILIWVSIVRKRQREEQPSLEE